MSLHSRSHVLRPNDECPKLIEKITEPSELVNEFTKFYCDFLPDLYDVKCPKFLEDVKSALKDMRRLKYDIDLRHANQFYCDIKYEKASVRCAYMYAYNVLNSAMVYHEFLKHLNDKENSIPGKLFGKKTLKICCLAGGPATEALAVSKAVVDFLNKSLKKSNSLTDVEVTVVDIVSEWETEGRALINALNNSSNTFISERAQFHYRFLKADLVAPFDEMLTKTISEANVVTVVKFASSMEEKSASVYISCLDDMIKNVIECMSPNCCLFMLDVAGARIFQKTMEVVSNQTNRCAAMNVFLHKKYRLLPKTLKKMETCINFRNVAEASTLFPTKFTTVSSCFWIKKRRKSEKTLSKVESVEKDKTQSKNGSLKNKANPVTKKIKKDCNKRNIL